MYGQVILNGQFFEKDGYYISADDNKICCIKTFTSTPDYIVLSSALSVGRFVLTPDGRYIFGVSANNKNILKIDLQKGNEEELISVGTDIYDVLFSWDNDMVYYVGNSIGSIN